MDNNGSEIGKERQQGPAELSRGDQTIAEVEIDLREFVDRGEAVPHARVYRVRIDDETVKVHTPCPNGEELLHKVHKRPCAFELIAEFRHHEGRVVEPNEKIDLREHRLRGFIAAHKEIVTVFINDKPYSIERGDRTVAEILSKVGQTPEGYILMEEKDGPPLPLPPNLPVKICGCEVFHSQAQSGGSS
jgi:Multiubiquitin